MATALPQLALSPDLRSILAGLRWRIRFYVWLEGLALAAIWIGLMFWVGLGLDYLPVILGASEMPAVARGVLLAATGLVLAYILYRWILSRTFVRLSDRSMALLLERRYETFHDSLVTSVEMSNVPEHASAFNRDLLGLTANEAQAALGDVRYSQVFNSGALVWKIVLALVIAASVAAFSGANAPAFERAAERLLLLSNEPWPRSAKIEVVGIEVLREPAPGETSPRIIALPFEGRSVKVAKGSNVALKVRAAHAPEAQIVPQQCTIYYRTKSSGEGVRGERGSVLMSSFRDAGSWRNFSFDGKPFKGVLATVEFDVLGYDHRVSGYKLEVVDSPAVVETKLDLVFPKYMVDEANAGHLPAADQPYLPAGTFIPTGTQVTLKFKSNKKLARAEIAVEGSDKSQTIEIDPAGKDRQSFSHRIDALPGSVALSISLTDTDNVTMERPYRVFLTAIEDQPPQVEVSLKGIGSSVTPDVIVPFRGKVSDDYGVAKSWFDVQVNEAGDAHDVTVALGKAGAVDQQIDFRHERAAKTGLEIKPGDKLFLSVKAADKFDLPNNKGEPGESHTATGDRYQLDVVTPEQLLAQLEVREVGLRRRFELIIDEMTQMRDSLLRVKASLSPNAAAGADLEDLRDDNDPEGKQLTPEKKAERVANFRMLRAQRALQQSQKSVAEVAGVAAGFLDIREELINNRVDTEDRKTRLKDLIADPLNKTCAEEFPRLDQKLQTLETKLREASVKLVLAEASPLADDSIDQANLVLQKLEEVLARMQDLETYNELLEIVRDLLKDQEKLIERTQQEQKRQLKEDLLK